MKRIKQAMRLFIWFLAGIMSFVIAVYILSIWPSASAGNAGTGDYIQGAALSSPQAMAAPLPLMADGDIQQPEGYTPRVPPGEESEPEALPENLPEAPALEDSEADVDNPVIDDFDEWYIPPEAYNSWVITPENTPPSVVPPLGYSGSSGSSGLSTELEYLDSINTTVSLIFYSITLVIAAGIVYLILRAVWPLFRG